MSSAHLLYPNLLCLMIVIAPFVFAILFYIPAPYGRYARPGWGPMINNRVGWLIMESPASLLMLIPFLLLSVNPLVYFFLCLWQLHYLHRAFIYPFSLKSRSLIPLSVIGMAFLFNIINAFLNGYYFSIYADSYDSSYVYNWNFGVGLAIFLFGFWANKKSDYLLQNTKNKESPVEYEIPTKFLYRYISCPNYFSESFQWFGWAVMTMAPPAWVFFIWTLANLLPRAITHHRWYKENYANYPAKRKAFIPFIL